MREFETEIRQTTTCRNQSSEKYDPDEFLEMCDLHEDAPPDFFFFERR
jgi:hypothetical protein